MAIAEVVQGAVQGTGNLGLGAWNAYNSYQQQLANNKAKSAANTAVDQYGTAVNQILNDAYNKGLKLSNAGDAQAYQDMKANYNPQTYVAEAYDDSKFNVDDYLNKNKDKILADVAKASQNTAAGYGVGHSSGAVESINQNIMDKSESMYNDAFNKMQQERSFDYGKYKDFIQQKQNELDSINNNYLNKMNLYKQDLQFDQNQADTLTNNKLGAMQTAVQTKAQLV